jgi:hypothetical protein
MPKKLALPKFTRKSFSKKFKRFLFSNRQLDLLPGYGWNDGGCWTLAQAIREWSGDSVPLYAVYSYLEKAGRPIVQHLVVELPDQNLHLDADGILTAYELLVDKMEDSEMVDDPYLAPFRKDLVRFDEIELLPGVATILSKRLKNRFGDFSTLIKSVS